MSRLNRGSSPGWREFRDFFCVRTILFQTLYVFFVVRHVNQEILHIAVTPYPTAEWTAHHAVTIEDDATLEWANQRWIFLVPESRTTRSLSHKPVHAGVPRLHASHPIMAGRASNSSHVQHKQG